MDKIALHGSIGSGDPEVVSRLLASWMKTDKMDVRFRLQGAEIKYQDDKTELYSYNADEDPEYLLEGYLSGSLDDANASLKRLLQLCQKQGLDCRFEYVQENEDGEETSEQFFVE
ncbi:hypothetical protein [Vitiosangium sp. GDMCC 1.1324]|uniref:hypothetical protein n=1 Tax=Vitiosangium sp. (strain GDMCC 1.1324) TaxID=2138576 RepID=UPI000D3BC38D|nr:hypothetical protein [Vitiosangium sp. GDMCC 1.1324]PTL77621.1 hypothetical protein DAT35_43280 [Vitiosangium sp. GDMCC 1.1324]